MKLKLGFRLVLLTGMLLVLVSTFRTQPAAACSPGWYDGCMSACSNNWVDCIVNGLPLSACNEIKWACQGNCAEKLAACQND